MLRKVAFYSEKKQVINKHRFFIEITHIDEGKLRVRSFIGKLFSLLFKPLFTSNALLGYQQQEEQHLLY